MITDYGSLVTGVANWAKRPDLIGGVPDCILLAEDYFNSKFRLPQMEQRATASATQYLAVPTDFLELRNIRLNTNPATPMEYVNPQYADEFYGSTATGQPIVYTIYDNQFVLYPPPDSAYTVEIDYYQKIPALSGTNTTNWLLTRYPRAYLYATLAEMLALTGDSRAQEAEERRDKTCQQIIDEAGERQFSGAPLYMRPMVQIA